MKSPLITNETLVIVPVLIFAITVCSFILTNNSRSTRKDACPVQTSQEYSQQPQEPSLWSVYEDRDACVTCYIYKDDSISCLPTKDLITNQ